MAVNRVRQLQQTRQTCSSSQESVERVCWGPATRARALSGERLLCQPRQRPWLVKLPEERWREMAAAVRRGETMMLEALLEGERRDAVLLALPIQTVAPLWRRRHHAHSSPVWQASAYRALGVQ